MFHWWGWEDLVASVLVVGISSFGIHLMLSTEDLTEKYSHFTKKCATEGYIVIIFIKEANE